MDQITKPQSSTKPSKTRKQPRKISESYLENSALYYLQRYASSAANLKTVMRRKIDRSCKFHNADPAPFYTVVDKMVERYLQSGLLDDTLYARGRVSSLRRQGHSRQGIIAKLSMKGIDKSLIEKTLEEIDGEKQTDDHELAAALALAKRKRLGPFRKIKDVDQKTRQKELATLGRAGFSYETARKALDYQDEDFT